MMRTPLFRMKVLPFAVVFLLGLALAACVGDKDAPGSSAPPQTVSMRINPEAATLPPGGELIFSASVSGSANTSVDWTVQEGVAGGVVLSIPASNEEQGADGTFPNKGRYSAPLSPGTYHVVATSRADSAQTATAIVTVSSALDASFGLNGTIRTTFSGIDTIKAMAVQSNDGKLVVGGASLDGMFSDFALARYHADGRIDTSFGVNGVVTTSFGGGAGINALAIQADGKIVAGGDTGEFQNGVFALARYNPDGTPDTTFGPASSGIVTATPGILDNRLNALKLQGDKILVGGVSFVPDDNMFPSVSQGDDAFTLMRFNADGSVDSSFGPDGNGIVKTLIENQFGTAASAEITALEIQSDGKILAGGGVSLSGGSSVLARYNADGTLDTTFGINANGYVVTSVSSGSDRINALLIQDSDDKIVAGGFALNSFALLRYTTAGIEDPSFSGDGIVTTTIGSGGGARVQSLVFDAPNNRIIAGGLAFNGVNNSEFALAAYNVSDGGVATAFGTNGIVTTSVSTGADGIQAMRLESGKMIAAGFASDGARTDFALARYNSDGSLDFDPAADPATAPPFDLDGIVKTAVGGGSSDEINALAIQATGEIIAAGFSFGVDNVKNKDFALARYTTDGVLDASFGISGRVTTSISGSPNTADDVINAIALQADGKIVVGGSAFQGNVGASDDFALARYLPDGSLDTTFGSGANGIVTRINTASDEVINGLALQNDQKIVVAGTAFTGVNHNFIVGRYNANGTLDTSFDSDGIVTTPIGAGSSFSEAMVIEHNDTNTVLDDKIILAGSAEMLVAGNGEDEEETTLDFALVRYNADGSLDTGFGVNGIVTTPVGSGHDFAETVIIQSDGKLLVAGSVFSDEAPEQFALVRYNADGGLDTAFGNNGIVMTPLGNTELRRNAQAFALAIQPSDGKIVVGGFSFATLTGRDFTLVRYNTDGTLDTGFGVAGIEISPFSAQMDEIHALSVLSDGTILAGGFITNDSGENTDFYLAAYTP